MSKVSENILGNIKDSKFRLKESEAPDITFTICYNSLNVWKSRKEALQFYKECASFSEGSEKERYTTILLDLMDGAHYAVDNYDEDDDVWEIDWMCKNNRSGNYAVKQKLDGHKSGKEVMAQIKSGKIMPPKEFLDYIEGRMTESKLVGKKRLTEGSDATPEFIEALKDFLNTYCEAGIKDLKLEDNGESVLLDNYKKINIAADSNLAAVKDIVSVLLWR